MPEFGNVETLTPDVLFSAAEKAFSCRFSGVLMPLPSYINRVYEMESAERERYIFKFYRPGRWSRAALLEEHLFTLEAREAEIPVIAPLRQAGGSTLGTAEDGTFFAAFPKRWGRGLEPDSGAQVWRRLGSLIARLHTVGAARAATPRSACCRRSRRCCGGCYAFSPGGSTVPGRSGCTATATRATFSSAPARGLCSSISTIC